MALTNGQTPKTLSAALALYVEWTGGDIAFRTVQKMGHELNRWRKHAGGELIADVSKELYAAFRKSCRADDLSANTIETTVGTINTLMRFCYDSGWIEELPSLGRRMERRVNGVPRQPSIDDLSKMWAHCSVPTWPRIPYTPIRNYWRAYLAVGYFTGLRFSDIARLTWQDVDSERLHFRPRKTGYELLIPMHPVCWAQLKKLPDGTRRLLLKAHESKMVRRSLGEICAAAGVERITAQQLRRRAETSWESAELGAGDLLLGRPMKGAGRYYCDRPSVAFAILKRAMPAVAVPESWCEGVDLRKSDEEVLLDRFRTLNGDKRRVVLELCQSLGS